jgi:hypothetical protein
VPKERPDGLDARRMTIELGESALARPAPVAVHDDRDMARQVAVGKEPFCVGSVRRGGLGSNLGVRPMRRRWRVGRAGKGRASH